MEHDGRLIFVLYNMYGGNSVIANEHPAARGSNGCRPAPLGNCQKWPSRVSFVRLKSVVMGRLELWSGLLLKAIGLFFSLYQEI